MTYSLSTGNNFTHGDILNVSVSGQPKSGSNLLATEDGTDKTGLIIGLGAFGLALVGAGVFAWNRGRRADLVEDDDLLELDELDVSADMAKTPEDLMDAIIALDDLYQAGDLPESAYLDRRAELKEYLRKMMEE